MEAMVYINIQQAINLLTINITNWGTKKTVVYNTSQRPDIIGREAKTIVVALLVILSAGLINLLVQIISSNEEFI